MKRYLMIFNVILFSFILLACNISGEINIGTTIGDGATWPGCVQISLDYKNYDLNDNIKIHFSYGHDYQGDLENYNIISHYIAVYVIDESQTSKEPEDGIILYERNITGDNLLSDDYRCNLGKSIFSKVVYNNIYDLSVDFSEYDFDNGIVVIRFYETFTAQENIDGDIVDTERIQYNGTQMFFIKDDKTIEFSEFSLA